MHMVQYSTLNTPSILYFKTDYFISFRCTGRFVENTKPAEKLLNLQFLSSYPALYQLMLISSFALKDFIILLKAKVT